MSSDFRGSECCVVFQMEYGDSTWNEYTYELEAIYVSSGSLQPDKASSIYRHREAGTKIDSQVALTV